MLNNNIKRRECIKIIGFLAASTSLPTLFVEPVFGKNSYKKISRTLPMMSTYVTITIYDTSSDRAMEAQSRAFSRMRELINIFNRFDKNSHVSWLNENKKLTDVPKELYRVLEKAKVVSKITSEKFDITILPLLETMEMEFKVHGHFPTPKEIDEVLPYIGWENISISPQKITLSKESKITLDGIAKGYIVDEAVAVLKKFKVKHALIDAGGDIRTLGSKDENTLWKIGIEDPTGTKEYITRVGLSNLSIATSGNYRNFFDPSKKIFHIVDREGRISPKRTTSCSVISKSGSLADGLATGFFSLPPEETIHIANKLNIPVLITTHGNRLFFSNTWAHFKV